ncbi:MAG TPA: class I SAM-dependent methyltransferase [Methylotenera sp.]|nr:class I SAM-dependent methyltransferase [Methylotenera sp.]
MPNHGMPKTQGQPLVWPSNDLAQQPRIKPATLALLLQLASVAGVFGIIWVSHFVAQQFFHSVLTFSMWSLCFLQATLSASLAVIFKQAPWWRWIHFAFPFAVFVMLQWQIPNEFYLISFIVTASLFWTTFRTQVPFYPSRPAVWYEVVKLIPIQPSTKLIDIGSGLGDMSMVVAKSRPNCQAEGIEIAPLPWLVSQVRARLKRSTARFQLGNYNELNFADYDIVFAYLSPAVMQALWQKAHLEMRPNSLLISLEFEIKDWPPSFMIMPKDGSPKLYVWRMP